MSQQDNWNTLIAWLNEAYAMEQQQIQVLQDQVDQIPVHTEAHEHLRRHLEQTRHHAELVERCLEHMGSSVSVWERGKGVVAGILAGWRSGSGREAMVKSDLMDYAAEAYEIATYRALIVGARALGQEYVAELCERILRDEEEMAYWLEQQIPTVVHEFLAEESAA